ncbi:hypothetical protein ACERK3_03830 [Phycisphaerales bacterium AB-hyl4]|uniref:Helix-turn-helix domain-containing protein n=1 Tax=Natronomicrosphaera hydrolytica TaxID=3242702 RepID=A0ABV4U1E0_9BACT
MSADDLDRYLAEYASQYPTLITLKQAAEIAQRPLATIYDWSSQGFFDEFKKPCGRERRLIRDRFVRFMLGLEPTSASAE